MVTVNQLVRIKQDLLDDLTDNEKQTVLSNLYKIAHEFDFHIHTVANYFSTQHWITALEHGAEFNHADMLGCFSDYVDLMSGE